MACARSGAYAVDDEEGAGLVQMPECVGAWGLPRGDTIVAMMFEARDWALSYRMPDELCLAMVSLLRTVV